MYPVARLRSVENGPPILVTGAQRSGTTWFGQMIARPGTRLYHEPLGIFSVLWNLGLDSRAEGADSEGMRHKMERIIAGSEWESFNWPSPALAERGTTRLSPVRFFGSPPGRVIIKDPTAVGIIEEITGFLECTVVALIRHPAGYVASLKRLGWDPRARIGRLLNHPSFECYGLSQFKNLHESAANDVELLALQHGLLNTVLVKSLARIQAHSVLYVFDELCEDPVDSFPSVFADLKLTYDDQCRLLHLRLSGPSSERSGVGPHDVGRRSVEQSVKWKKDLSRQEVEAVRRIWDRFDLPYFSEDRCWAV